MKKSELRKLVREVINEDWKNTEESIPVGTTVKVNYGKFKGKIGKVSDEAPSGKFSVVTVGNETFTVDNSDLLIKEETLKEYTHGKFKTKMIRNAKNSKGFELRSGDDVELFFPEDKLWFTHIYKVGSSSDAMKMIVQTKNLYLYVKGASKPPSLSSLERMVEDGVSKSVLGKRVEPDGTDEYGSPSWLLVLGMI